MVTKSMGEIPTLYDEYDVELERGAGSLNTVETYDISGPKELAFNRAIENFCFGFGVVLIIAHFAAWVLR